MTRIIKTLKGLTDRHGGTARLLSAVLACAMALGLCAPFASTASASAGTADLTTGGKIFYDKYNTHDFNVSKDGQTNKSYCLESNKQTPPSGTYGVSELNAPSGRTAEVRVQMWFGYGGPGFDRSMWPSTWYDGNPMSDANYYALTHILMSSTYLGNFDAALTGTTDAFRDWISVNLVGAGDSGVAGNPNSVMNQMNRRAGEVPGEDVFDTFEMHTLPGLQNMSGFTYHPKGYLNLRKVSANPSLTDGNDCYSLAGAQFAVSDASGNTVGTLTTDASGNTSTIELDPGTYTVRETAAPKGYLRSEEAKTVEVKSQQTATVQFDDIPGSDPMALLLGKYDGEKTYNGEGNLPQGSASLAGAQFTVEYYDTLDYASYDALKQANVKPTRSWIVRTDKDGFSNLSEDYLVSGSPLYHSTNGDVTLPRGTVVLYESKAPEGYLLNKDVSFQKIQEQPTNAVVTYNAPKFPETVKRGGVKVSKRDIESGLATPLGGASLDGTQFEIRNKSARAVLVDGVSYANGEVVKTLTIKNGEASTAADALPYGSYTLQEVKVGEGYLLTDGNAYRFDIRDNGTIVNPVAGGAVKNQVKRSDFEFDKKADVTGDHLASVPFKVTSKTTGESHVAVTDENGYFSSASSWNKHTDKTNANDWALGETGSIDSGRLDASAGFWFGKTTEGSTVKANDKLGAMPYDTYSIEELRCTNNEGYQLIHTSIDVTRDGKVYDFGTLDDQTASIHTNAYDPADKDDTVGAGETKVADKVTYTGLIPGRTYRLVAELHDAKTGDPIKGEDGRTITMEKTFVPEQTSGHEVMEITVDTCKFAGKTLVVYERLLDEGGSVVAKHTDKDDTDQQVSITPPQVGTKALDGYDGDKNVVADKKVTIVDTVAYNGLTPGTTYKVTGTLHVKTKDGDGKAKDEALEVNGKPVTAEAEFTAKAASGTVDVTFTFDGSAIPDDTTVVAFETLTHKGHEVAVHADIDDEDQSVTIKQPSIGTTAKDGIDGDKTVVADALTTVTDKVSYENVLDKGDTPYTMAGLLMDKATGLPILKDGGKFTKAAVTAFMDKLSKVLGLNAETSEPYSAAKTGKADEKDEAKTAPIDIAALKALVKENADLVSQLVWQTSAFTPNEAKGNLSMDYRFNANAVIDRAKGETKDIVVFEVLVKGNLKDGETPVIVAEERDLKNEGQTVKLVPSTIGTTATDKADGDHTATADKNVAIVDTVAYKNLIPGKEYRLTGTLMDKATKEPVKVDGKPVTSEAKFTPDKADGTTEVTFAFDASKLGGHDVVVFEELHKQGVDADGNVEDTLVAEHKDIDDKGQTVHMSEKPEGSTYGKTGGNAFILPIAIAALAVLAGGAAFYAVRNRKHATGRHTADDEEE